MSVGAIAKEIAAVPNVKAGTLRFWGDWFGKPHDNIHRVVRCSATENALVVEFDAGERLVVENPKGVSASPNEFYITDATRLRWEWFYYGRPQTSENLYFMEYARSKDGVAGSTNVDWYEHTFSTSSHAKAVEIL